jgi:hypothetical protein
MKSKKPPILIKILVAEAADKSLWAAASANGDVHLHPLREGAVKKAKVESISGLFLSEHSEKVILYFDVIPVTAREFYKRTKKMTENKIAFFMNVKQ